MTSPTGPASSAQRSRAPSRTERILEHAWSGEPLTTSDLMVATGLTRSTVIGACDELIARGWLRRLDDAPSPGSRGMGRPAHVHVLRRDRGVVVGVDAALHQVTARVADPVGETLAEYGVDHPGAGTGALERRRVIDEAVARALDAAHAARTEVLALTVGVPAPVDALGASPIGEGDFWQRMNPSLQQHFSARSWATVVENDANLAALACADAEGGHDQLTLLSREELGAGVLSGGRLLRGAHGHLGELRLLRRIAGVGSTEGIAALIRRERRVDRTGPPDGAPDPIPVRWVTPEDLIASAASGDADAVDVVDRLGVRIGIVLATLAGMLDVNAIVLAGASRPVLDAILETARPTARALAGPTLPRLVPSSFGDSVVVEGAVRSALATMRENA